MGQDRSSKLVNPTAQLPQRSDEEVVRIEAENGLRQADRMFEMLGHAIATGKFRLRPSTLIELNRLAVEGLVVAPGAMRPGAMMIEYSRHQPPPHEDVPGYVDDMCDYVFENWEPCSAIHLAAYVLWRLNWIHPFEDGNGRTARATSYLVLCASLGSTLPGTKTIPEVIAADKQPYYEALEAADEAWRAGQLDLFRMESLLTDALAAQLLDVVGQANASTAPPVPSQATVVTGKAKEAERAEAATRKPRVFVGSSTEGLPIAEALQVGLEYDAEVVLWSQGVFGLSEGTLETLTEKASGFDFAVLALTPDDMLVKRGNQQATARDNILFELGLFMGTFGRYRTFVVHPRNKLELPTDLAGVTTATYDDARSDGDLQAALGPSCTKIKRAVRDQGLRSVK